MRLLYLVTMIYLSLFLSACSATGKNNPTGKIALFSAPTKNPMTVAFYEKKQAPKSPYKIIGKATVSKYNWGGIKRQEASIHDALRDLAASMGGDAVINIARDEKSVSGTVIAYQDTHKKAASPV